MAYIKFEQLCIDKEFEELLPVLTPDEFSNLEQSILKSGLLDPIKIWQDPDTSQWLIIDGHNRYNVLKKNNIKFNMWQDYKILDESDGIVTRDDVKKWMFEQQLGRRNLSEVERYEVVQKFKSIIQEQAKENQSAGGKGLSNLTKVNSRKVLADKVGVSEGTYSKLDKVMQSDNEEVKEKLRNKEVSIDGAYRKIKQPKQSQDTVTKSDDPKAKIERIDRRIIEIDLEVGSLKREKEVILNKRANIFSQLEMKCDIQYEFLEDTYCSFYIEYDGKKQELAKVLYIYLQESPECLLMAKIPQKYKSDFLMVYDKAHKEDVENKRKRDEEFTKQFHKEMSLNSHNIQSEEDKVYFRKIYKVLATKFHPDGKDGDETTMKYVNALKEVWGI